jgi:hypothetical protein
MNPDSPAGSSVRIRLISRPTIKLFNSALNFFGAVILYGDPERTSELDFVGAAFQPRMIQELRDSGIEKF